MNGTGVGSGLGTGIVLGWLWTTLAVPRGFAPMPPDVAGAIVMGAAALGHWLETVVRARAARAARTPATAA